MANGELLIANSGNGGSGGFQFSVFSFQCSVLSFQFSVFSAQSSVLGFQGSGFSVQRSAFSVQLSVVSCQSSVVSRQRRREGDARFEARGIAGMLHGSRQGQTRRRRVCPWHPS